MIKYAAKESPKETKNIDKATPIIDIREVIRLENCSCLRLHIGIPKLRTKYEMGNSEAILLVVIDSSSV